MSHRSRICRAAVLRLTLVILILVMTASVVSAQERLFWDFPETVAEAGAGRFPTLLRVGGRMALVWQEFSGERGSLESTIGIRALFSDDGANWDTESTVVADGIPYLWQEEVPLFSAATGTDGRLTVAVSRALEGVAIYRQLPNSGFEQTAIFASSPQAADTAVAPRLTVTSTGEFLLFLTRRSAVAGSEGRSILTIYTAYSSNGRDWSDPELFVDPSIDVGTTDRHSNSALLEHNFLPTHLAVGNQDFVAFQSLRLGPGGRTYQIYLKKRSSGGPWSPAEPITEILTPNEGDPYSWSNQRPQLGLSADGEILLAWERSQSLGIASVSLAVIGADGTLFSELVEDVVVDNNASAAPQILDINDQTWIVWFDNTGVRTALRQNAYNYQVQPVSLDAGTPGSDRGSAIFPAAVDFQGTAYLAWQDTAAGRHRTIILRPDLDVDRPRLAEANFVSGRPGRSGTLVVDWIPPVDSSGVLSHSWVWSQNPSARPSRQEIDQVYGRPRSVFTIENPQDSEGPWYFTLIARDQAGNWSEPMRLTYILDVTPPPPPLIRLPATDPYGYLRSNTFDVSWEDAEDDRAEFYRWRMDYLGSSPDRIDFALLDAISDGDIRDAFDRAVSTESTERITSWANLDNGVWAFSVTSVDRAGNEGLPSTSVILANRYIPVTFITDVTSRKDASDRTVLRIVGRGFSTGGLLTAGIIDRDGVEPWDYVYSRSGEQLRLSSDRIVEIIGIEDMEEGIYRIGVTHPLRGTVFWNRTMKLDSTGNVKFGPFGLYAYESLWTPAARSLRLTGNQFLAALLLFLAIAAVAISAVRMIVLFRDSRRLEADARAILARRSMTLAAREEAVLQMRSKGMRLRFKFMMWLTVLVGVTILLLAAFLGIRWIQMERDALAEGLESESRLLVETLASAAVTSIPAADRGALLAIPDRIAALPDALWTIVTGPRAEIVGGTLRAQNDGYEYVWTANDDGILDKLELPRSLDAEGRRLAAQNADDAGKELLESAYPVSADGTAVLNSGVVKDHQAALAGILRDANLMPTSPGIGEWRVEDVITPAIENLREETEQAIQDAGITEMVTQLAAAEAERIRILDEIFEDDGRDFNDPEFIESGEAVAAQKKEIETLLLEVSSDRFASYPKFDSDALRPGGPEYFIFYKPLLYRAEGQGSNFFRGTVRVAVSIDDIRRSLKLVQRRIIGTTIWVSALALAIGIGAALFIASVIARPITRLGLMVQRIQDEKDKENLRGFDTGIRSGDEIGVLSENINELVKDLVQGAKEQKQLLAGQEIQKTFLPMLEIGENKQGDAVRLSTGGDSNAFFRLFGYYEGADAVSGDFFGYRELDEDHRVLIKLDIAGHGVTASMIMVQAASLFVDYFRQVANRVKAGGRLEYDLSRFTFGLNDLMNEVKFKGRFAAFNLSVINVRTGDYEMIHAGDNLVNIYDPKTGTMRQEQLDEAPAAGQIDTALIEMQNDMRNLRMYQPVKRRLERGEILFLYTDGIEEAHHLLRNEECEEVRYSYFSDGMKEEDQKFIDEGYKTIVDIVDDGPAANADPGGAPVPSPRHGDDGEENQADQDKKDPRWEEFDTIRINDVIESVMHRKEYVLVRRLDLTIGHPLHFDFTILEPNGENCILALASVERVFRLVPDPSAGANARIKVDRKIDDFLKSCFREYDEFFHHPVAEESDVDYVYFSHILDDPQDDDLTLWAFERL